MRRRAIALLWAALLYVGLVFSTSCGTPTYYSSSVGYYGYYGRGGWYDPYYYRPCCRGSHRPDRPHRPPGMRPPGSRPPHGGRPPSMPSRPRRLPCSSGFDSAKALRGHGDPFPFYGVGEEGPTRSRTRRSAW